MIASLIKIMLAVAAALLTGKLVSRLKLPSILGWLLAGMLVGPHGLRLMDSGILDALWYQNTIHVLECAVGLMTVSYTHLDVYKRQSQGRLHRA